MTGWSRSSPAARRGRGRLGLGALAAIGIVLTVAAYSASAASTSTLTATAVHISDHPAYVEAAMDFSGLRLAANRVRASDPDPSDGTGDVLVSYPDVANRLSVVTAHGLAVWLVEVPYGLNVGLRALPGAFKYLSYRVAGSDELVVKVWKSTIGPAGNVFQGQGGCLTLNRVSAAPGMVTASGTAHGLFENRFRAVLRDAFGGVLASRSESASGGWRVALRYTAPQGQGASFEAAANSAKDGALACLVQNVFALPASNLRANLHVVYRAYADVNGDGRRDLATVRRKRRRTPGRGAVRRRSARHHARAHQHLHVLARRSGQRGHAARLRRRLRRPLRGHLQRPGDAPLHHRPHFYIKFGTHQWMRQDTVYAWQGPALKLLTRGAAQRLRGQPPPPLIGVQCGHLPSEAAASDRPAAARPASGPPIAPLAATNPPTQRTNYSHSRCDNGGSRLARAPSCTRGMGHVHKEELSLRQPS